MALVTIFVLLVMAWGWFYWGWSDEQRVLVELHVRHTGVLYTPIVSPWLRGRLGPSCYVLDRVTWIGLFNRGDITDYSPLTRLAKLEALDLTDSPITDISSLIHLRNIKMLSLKGTKVTNLSPLVHLINLKAITLTDTPTEDISPLAALHMLTSLSLDGTSVKDITPLYQFGCLVIDLPKSTFTETQVDELQQRFPGWIIQRK